MADSDSRRADAFGVRVWLECLATQELLCTYVGIRLGLYEILASGDALTSRGLAERAGMSERYAREWLEQQAVAGVLELARPSRASEDRAYRLPGEHARVLTASDDPLSRVASILPLGGVAGALPALLDAYKTGAGVSAEAFGDDWRSGHGDANRAVFTHGLPRWLERFTPRLAARLSAGGARAVDVACGGGWAAIALGVTYPELVVDGVDVDPAVVELARDNARRAGMSERVRFEVADCAAALPRDDYDLVCVFDTLHEVAKPVEILRACRAARAPNGEVLVLDAKVADAFVAPGGDVERFQYTTSVLHCLPAGLEQRPSAAPGTVMRASTVVRFAEEAGFESVDRLPIDDRFHRLYRLW